MKKIFSIDKRLVKLPITFNNIIDEIISSLEFLNFGEVSTNVYDTSIKFLIDSSLSIYNKNGLVISTPEINLCRDGSIDLSWRKENVRLLVNIKENSEGILKITYYGDINKGDETIKGSFSADKISQHLIVWMENLL
jgi:hypothetical protein